MEFKNYPIGEVWTDKPITDEEYVEIGKKRYEALKQSMEPIRYEVEEKMIEKLFSK